MSCHCPEHRVKSVESDLSTPAKIRLMPRKRDGRVGEIDDNSSCCITSFFVTCTRIHHSLAPRSASSRSQQRDDFTVHMHMKQQVPAEDRPMQLLYAPTPPFAEPTPQLPGLHPKAPPDARLSLPLVFAYIKGSSCMRCLAAAANDLGSCKHAWPGWWPTETTQWSESLHPLR